MALITCPACNKVIADGAASCLECGHSLVAANYAPAVEKREFLPVSEQRIIIPLGNIHVHASSFGQGKINFDNKGFTFQVYGFINSKLRNMPTNMLDSVARIGGGESVKTLAGRLAAGTLPGPAGLLADVRPEGDSNEVSFVAVFRDNSVMFATAAAAVYARIEEAMGDLPPIDDSAVISLSEQPRQKSNFAVVLVIFVVVMTIVIVGRRLFSD